MLEKATDISKILLMIRSLKKSIEKIETEIWKKPEESHRNRDSEADNENENENEKYKGKNLKEMFSI